MKSEKMREDLARAKQRVTECQARVKDLEKRITVQENLEIVQMVRSINVTPEELWGMLEEIKSKGVLSDDGRTDGGNKEPETVDDSEKIAGEEGQTE